MINSAATTAQYSAAGNNCYNMRYIVVEKKKRDIEPYFPLVERAVGFDPAQSDMYVCNVGAFAGVQYFNPFWREQPTPGASDYLNAEFSFQVGPGGQFTCDFIGVLTDALAVVQPEFGVEDVELGEELQAICSPAEDAINGLTMRSIGRRQQDIVPEDQATNPYRSLVPASSETSLKKHTDSGENVMDTLVKDLYEGAPSSNKVAAGAPAGVFKLDAGTSGVYTTVECYGCTAVVLFSGKTVAIQLFTEAPFASSSSASTWTDKVITPLESTLIANKDDLGENPLIAIFSPWFANPSQPPTPEWSDTPPPQTPGVFKYKTRLIGSNSIMASIKSDFPNLAAQELIGYTALLPADEKVEDTSAGKIVLEWQAPNSNCAESAGIGTLNLYAEDSWYLSINVDENGEVVNMQGSSPSACSLAEDDALDDGNSASSEG